MAGTGLYEAKSLAAVVEAGGATATAYSDSVDNLWNLGGHHGRAEALAFVLNISSAAAASGDKLDVYVQTLLDGTNWADVARFTQVLGNGGAKRYFKKLTRAAAMSEFENASALGAAAQRDLFGSRWRVKYVVTDAGSAASLFSFTVHAIPG